MKRKSPSNSDEERENDQVPRNEKRRRVDDQQNKEDASAKVGPSEFEASEDSDMKTAVNELYEAVCIKTRGPEIKAILDNYYKGIEEGDTTLVTLFVNLGIKASGSHAVLSEDAVHIPYEDSRRISVLKYIAKKADANVEIPTMQTKSKDMKRVRSRLNEWWKKLVKYLHNHTQIASDDKTIGIMSHWFIDLSGSKIRFFRDVGTQLCLGICSGLIFTAVDYSKELSNVEHSLESETKKPAPSETRIQALTDTRTDYNEKVSLIHEQIRPIFNKVFIHRYRDISEDIRVLCMGALSLWLETYPSVFLEDPKLKYLGWCLSDKHDDVRRESLNALHKICRKSENIPRLENFLDRFKPRILQMTRDRHSGIAAEAIDLCCTLLRHDILDENEGDDIQGFVYCREPEIRKAAANFIFYDSFDQADKEEEVDEEQRIIEDLIELLEMFTQEMKKRYGTKNIDFLVPAEYFVNAMWPLLDCLKNWNAMVDLLLSAEEEEHRKREKALENKQNSELTDTQQTLMFYLLLAAGRKATGKLQLDDSIPPRRKSKDEKADEDKHKQTFLQTIINKLPKLFFTFQNDSSKIQVLAQLPRLLPSKSLTDQTNISRFREMVKYLVEMLPNQHKPRVIHECCKTLGFMKECAKGKVQDVAQMVDELGRKLKDDFTWSVTCTLEEREPRSIYLHCLRLNELKKTFDITSCGVTDEMMTNLLKQTLENPHEHKIAKQIVGLVVTSMMWNLGNLNWMEPQESLLTETVELKKILVEFMKSCSRSGGSLDKFFDDVQTDVLQSLFMLTTQREQSPLMDALTAHWLDKELKSWLLGVYEDILKGNSRDEDKVRARDEKKFRVLIMASRFCILDPERFESFGALVVKWYIGRQEKMDLLIKTTMNVLKREYGVGILLDIMFRCFKSLHKEWESGMCEDTYPVNHIATLAKKLAQYLVFDRTVDWQKFITRLLDFGMTSEKQFKFLEPAVLPFVGRTKLEIRDAIKSKFLEREDACALETVQQNHPESYNYFQRFKASFLKILNKSRKPAENAEPSVEPEQKNAPEVVDGGSEEKSIAIQDSRADAVNSSMNVVRANSMDDLQDDVEMVSSAAEAAANTANDSLVDLDNQSQISNQSGL